MAKNLGMDSVAVTYGVHCANRLGVYEPVKVVDDVSGLTDFLMNNSK